MKKESLLKKEILRYQFRILRDKIPSLRRKKLSQAIARQVTRSPWFLKSKVIGLYLRKGSEVDTKNILKTCYQHRKRVALPKVRIKGHQLDFRTVERGKKDCTLGYGNIWEPKSSCPKAKKLDLIIVPGVLFDRRGYRIGYGKGFYDRFLKKNKKVKALGITYEKTLIRKLPHSKNDVAVDAVVTEKKIYKFR